MSERMLLPRLGETMDSGKITAWLVQPGSRFRRGETIVEIESDKTVVELPALADGLLMAIIAEAGSEVAVGEVLCLIDVDAGSDDTDPPSVATETPPRAEASVSATDAIVALRPEFEAMRTGRLRVTPKARHLARTRAIDLAPVVGTGRRGRIEVRDLLTKSGAATTDEVTIRETPFGPLAWRSWGDERAAVRFVLIHGFAGDSKSWSSFAAILARHGAYVLAPDLPSHGMTRIEADSLPGLTQPIVAWMDEIASSPVQLVGHSLGAAVAAGVATATPRHVAHLSLVAPVGCGIDIDQHFIDGMSRAKAPAAIAHLLRRLALSPPPMSPAQRDAIFATIEGRLPGLADTIAIEGRQQIDLISVLPDLAMPVRVVWGTEDRILPWNHAGQIPPMIPVHFVQSAGHMVHWDQPKLLADLLTEASNLENGGFR